MSVAAVPVAATADPLARYTDDFIVLWATPANDPGELQFVASWRTSQDTPERRARTEEEWAARIGPGPWDHTTSAERWAWPLSTETFGPRPFQVRALRRAVDNHLVLDHGMSAGKTTTILATLEVLAKQRVLILIPKKLYAVWRDEIDENAIRAWVVCDDRVPSRRGGHLANPSVARRIEHIRARGADALRLQRPLAVIVNYEALSAPAMKRLVCAPWWDAIVCDESHRLASAKGAWSKTAAKATQQCRIAGGRILEGTGTFAPHSTLSVFGQMRALQPGVLGWSSTAFKARYARFMVKFYRCWCAQCQVTSTASGRRNGAEREAPTTCTTCGGPLELIDTEFILGPGGDKIPLGVKPDLHDELMARIAPWVDRVSQAEVDAMVGLVGAVPQLRTVALDAPTRKAYDDLERDLIARYEAGVITSANAMTNFGTLLRICNGHGRNAQTGEMTGLHLDADGLCAKARLLLDELQSEDEREPVVVFANWVFDFAQIQRVCELLDRRYGELSGRRTDGLDGKYMAPGIDVLAVQWKAGSEGLNFTRSRHEIDYSLSTESVLNDQAPRRLNRQGQTRPVTRRVLAIEDSVEINWFYALKRRRDVNAAVLGRLERRTP